MLATFAAALIASTTALPELIDVSVRTPTQYVAGTGCDPEIVQLIVPEESPSQMGVVDAACGTVAVTPQVPTGEAKWPTGGVEVLLGGVTYTGCRLAAMQRNHYPEMLYVAWGYVCENATP